MPSPTRPSSRHRAPHHQRHRGDPERRIEAAGAGVATPAGISVIDGRGLFVYPGLIDSGDRMGLTEIGSVPGGQDTQELGQFNPQNDVITAVNPSSVHIPMTRANGVTSAITSAQGGMIQGTAALIDLAGWTPDEMATKGRVAMVMTYPRVGGGGGRGGFRGGQAAAGRSRGAESPGAGALRLPPERQGLQ